MNEQFTLEQFIEHLQGVLEQHGDMPVRVAFQPSYPLVGLVENIAVGTNDDDSRPGKTLWLATDQVTSYRENPYAPRAAWNGEEFGSDEGDGDE